MNAPPAYNRLRITFMLKKIVTFLGLPTLLFLILHNSEYCPNRLVPIFTAALVLILWFVLRMYTLFWPDFEGEVVKISVRKTKLLRTFSQNERIRSRTVPGLGSQKMSFSVGTSYMNESNPGVFNILRVKRLDKGKTYTFHYTNQILPGYPAGDALFPVGTRVRHLRGLPMVIKSDPSGDKKLLCPGCMALVDPGENRCWRCDTRMTDE